VNGRTIGEQAFSGLPYQLSAMLVVSSHADGTLATAHFDNVVIEDARAMQSLDIGTATHGTTSSNGPEVAIEGDGTDIWGTADAFRFHYLRWNGNATITVRIRSLENTNAWAKAGVMFRESLAPGSKQVMAVISPSKGAVVQYRSATSGPTATSMALPAAVPGWLSLRRFGDRFEASWSVDGEAWVSLFGIDVPMNADLYIGLPVTSHSGGTLATAVFDDLVIRPW